MKEESLSGLPVTRPAAPEPEPAAPGLEPAAPETEPGNVLNRAFTPSEPNQVWASDITYLETEEGWMYLAVVLDLFSRKVIGVAMGEEQKTELPLKALKQALAVREPQKDWIHHSDRGSQYRSWAYQKVLREAGAVISLSRAGQCQDNAVVESFFGTMKTELGRKWRKKEDCEREVKKYIHGFYNEKRLHGHNGQQSPNERERRARASRTQPTA